MEEKEIYLYRIIHIDNIPHILKNGITHRNSPNANANYVPIGDNGLIEKRTEFQLNNGTNLGEYIPFYFATRTPMLYVIQNGYNGVKQIPAEEIVYCVTSVEKIVKTGLEFIFTDGHAKAAISNIYNKTDIRKVNQILDWNAINENFWAQKEKPDLKRKKEAEFLILGDIPFCSILEFIVSNKNAENKLIEMGIMSNKIRINNNIYY